MVIYLVAPMEQYIGHVKIGYTSADSMTDRLQALQIGVSTPLVTLWTCDGDMALERWLHRHFAERRVQGEWFNFFDVDPVLSVEREVRAKDARIQGTRHAYAPLPKHATEAALLSQIYALQEELEAKDRVLADKGRAIGRLETKLRILKATLYCHPDRATVVKRLTIEEMRLLQIEE